MSITSNLPSDNEVLQIPGQPRDVRETFEYVACRHVRCLIKPS